ncbi:MAG TPA: hypothetical protein VFP37_05685, partial [Steroidobacteraceae bacterium]|nr:hypothetical protein [Steroidobacteraceae bacterium]
ITATSLAVPPPAEARSADPPAAEGVSSRGESRDGGGAMDALFVAVLAQLAFAGALRRRRASWHATRMPA